MAVVMRVGAVLDERSTQRVADRAERTFNDAGARSGRGFGQSFQQQVESALTERTVEKSARKIEAALARSGKTGAEQMNQAIANEANRTGLAADKIGEALRTRLGVHGTSAGAHFSNMFMGELDKVAPQVSGKLRAVEAAGRTAMEAVGGGAVGAVGGVLAVGAAAVEVTKHLYEIGQTFDNVSRSAEIQTGKMGSDLQELTESIDHVAVKTAASLGTIGNIAAQVSVAFHASGEPLENLTKQIADLDEMTGQHTNIRELGQVTRAFGLNAEQSSEALDMLKVASEHTLAPVDELSGALKSMGPSARSLHLDLGQTAAVIDMFEQAGLDATTTTKGLNKAVGEAAKHHIDLHTVLQRTIEETQRLLAAGKEAEAIDLAKSLMGKGYQPFIDAVRQGKLNVDDLNAAMKTTADAGHIERLREDTMRWSDTWKIVKNRIDDVAKSLGALTVFNTVQEVLRDLSGYRSPALEHPGYVNPDMKPGPLGALFPSLGPGGQVNPPLGTGGAAAPGAAGPPPPGRAPLPPELANSPLGPLLQWRNAQPPSPDQPPGPSLEDQLADDPNKVKTPHVPYPAGYGAPPAPGEPEEHYRLRMGALEKQHEVAEKQAALDDLEKHHTDKQEEIQAARNEVVKAQMESDTAGRELQNYRGPKPEVPFDARYGAPPRPGEPERLYTAEQGLLEAQHKRAEAVATLSQLNSAAGVTDEERTKARNELAAAERGEAEAQMKLREAALNTSKDLGDLGAAIDNDFGISKGIPGIVENMTKTIANLAAAPMLGKLSALSNIAEAQTGIEGGSGLIGILGARNLAEGRSPLFGSPLTGAGAEAGYTSIGGGGGLLGNLLGLGGPGLGRSTGQTGYIPGGAPTVGGGGANLYQDAAGRYHSRDAWWEGNMQAESGGNINPPGNATHFGLFQFAQSTWDGVARQVAPEWVGRNPGTAPADVQAKMAQALYNQNKGNLHGQWANAYVGQHPEGTTGSIYGGGDTNSVTTSQPGASGPLDARFTDLSGFPKVGPPDENTIRSQVQQMFGIPNTFGTGSWENAAHDADGLWHHSLTHDKSVPGYAFDFRGTDEQMDALSNWIQQNAAPETLELIHQGPGFHGGISRGKPWTPSPQLLAEHGGASTPGGHVHWATTALPSQILGGGAGVGGTGLSGGPFGSATLSSASGVVNVFVTNMPGGGGFPAAPAAPGPGGPAAAPPPGPAPAPGGGNTPGPGDPNDVTDNRPGGGGWLQDPNNRKTPSPAAPAPPAPPPAPTPKPPAPPPPPTPSPLDQLPGGASGQPGATSNPWSVFGPNTLPPGPIPQGGGIPGMPGMPPAAPAGAPGGQASPHVQSADYNTRTGGPGGLPSGFQPWWSPHQGGGGAAGPGPGNGPTRIGGVEPLSNPQGGGVGITPGGSVDTAMGIAASMFPGVGQAAQTGVKLANRAIQYGSQVAAIGASGLLETFLPTGGSELASKGWLPKIIGGIAGARPQIPNLAGGAGGGAMQPGQGGGQGQGGDQTINNHVTVNQASNNPANDITHALGVQQQGQYNNNPSMGR